MIRVIALLAFIAFTSIFQQDDLVSLEIIEDGKTRTVTFQWPFKGPPPIGSDDLLINKVDSILKENDIDCPPERRKVSDEIWVCGNGKLIKPKDKKLSRLFNKAWKN